MSCTPSAPRRLRRLYGHTPAAEFGPRWLKLLRQDLIDSCPSRKYINDTVNRDRRVFRWTVSEELPPVAAMAEIQYLAGTHPDEICTLRPRDLAIIDLAARIMNEIG